MWTVLHVGTLYVNVSTLHRSCLSLLFPLHNTVFLGFRCAIAHRSSSFIFIVTWYSKDERSIIYLSIL